MEIEKIVYKVDREVKQNYTRVKAFIINSKNEILLALSRGGCQLPGGHLEDGEKIDVGLRRELLEETGISFDEKFTRFFEAHYIGTDSKNSQVIYHYTHSDKDFNLAKAHHTDREKEYNFRLIWTSLPTLPEVLEEYRKSTDIPINIAIIDELKLAHSALIRVLNNN